MLNQPAPQPEIVNRGPRHKPGFSLVELLVVVAVVAIAVAFFLPAVRRGAGEAAHRSQCRNNLKQIGIALHNYHEKYGVYPPAYTVDATGRRLHSWRTLILPYLEQSALYDQIDLSKPWDDPVNAEVFETAVNVYRCPSGDTDSNRTTCLAIVTSNSCLQPGKGTKASDITDGTGNTLLVIEVDHRHAVPWMSPQDADESLFLSHTLDSHLPHEGGFNVLFADGFARFLSADVSSADRRAMITTNAGDSISKDAQR